MKRFAENYARVQETLNELLQGEYSMAYNIGAILKGYERLLERFETLLGISISIALSLCEELARLLQHSFHAAGIKEAAETLCEAMSRLRSEVAFEEP